MLALLLLAGVLAPPRTMLWAWEAPQDLRFLKATDTGVAYLAASVYLRGQGVLVRPRRQPLRLPESIYRMPVIRIDCDPKARPTFSEAQLQQVIDEITTIVNRAGATSLQIDFDARVSERASYKRLLAKLRPKLQFLSMTALPSWCSERSWTRDLPVDEVVPMAFRATGDASCSTSLGIAATDAIIRPAGIQRLYIFKGDAWTEAQAALAGRQ